MAASNTKFKVENGLDVVGSANVGGTLRVEGDLSVNGNLLTALNLAGDIKPTVNNTLNLGSVNYRWNLFANTGDFTGNLSITDTTTVNNAVAANLVAAANNSALGSSSRRWDFYANNANLVTVGVTGNATLANITFSGTLSGGILTTNSTQLTITNGTVSVNTGSKLSVYATGNSSYSNLSLNNDVTAIAGNVVFDTDLFFLDAVNNRVGVKTTSPSTAAVLTITGNAEFNTGNTGVRFTTANASVNSSIVLVANTTNSRVTFATYDNSNSTTQDGGYNFNGVNSSATQTLLNFNNYEFKYKSGNVAHSGNFGIYNVSGTRVGP